MAQYDHTKQKLTDAVGIDETAFDVVLKKFLTIVAECAKPNPPSTVIGAITMYFDRIEVLKDFVREVNNKRMLALLCTIFVTNAHKKVCTQVGILALKLITIYTYPFFVCSTFASISVLKDIMPQKSQITELVEINFNKMEEIIPYVLILCFISNFVTNANLKAEGR